MIRSIRITLLAAAAAFVAQAALADVNIGVTLALTGPGSGLGIPIGNYFKLFPKEIAGEKLNLIILDDASDPGKGVSNARRLVTDDKVDMIIGSCIDAGRGRDRAGRRRGEDRRSCRSRRSACRRARSRGCSACRRAST